jgi:hypothetical protein
MLIGSQQMMQQIQTLPNINFISKNLIPVTEVKNPGMFLDSHLSYKKHIQALSSSCISELAKSPEDPRYDYRYISNEQNQLLFIRMV